MRGSPLQGRTTRQAQTLRVRGPCTSQKLTVVGLQGAASQLVQVGQRARGPIKSSLGAHRRAAVGSAAGARGLAADRHRPAARLPVAVDGAPGRLACSAASFSGAGVTGYSGACVVQVLMIFARRSCSRRWTRSPRCGLHVYISLLTRASATLSAAAWTAGTAAAARTMPPAHEPAAAGRRAA